MAEVSPTVTTSATRLAWWERLTVADALFALLLLAGGLLRMVHLGRIPLSPEEAAAALPVWQYWQPGEMAAAIPSPAYFTLSNLVLPLVGDSDGSARLVPALFGIATAGLPWLLHGRLGYLGGLAAVLALAFSTLLINLSRTAGGDAIAIFAVAMLLAALLRWQNGGGKSWAMTAGGALGLGLASSALFYSGLLALAAAWLATRGRRAPAPAAQKAEAGLRLPRTEWQAAGLGAGIVFLLFSSFFLLHPAGLGAAARLPALWLGRLAIPVGSQVAAAISDPLLVLGRYEPLLLLALPALIAAFWSLGEEKRPGLFFVLWLGSIALICFLQPGVPENVALAIFPAALLAGFGVEVLFRQSRPALPWVTWGIAGGFVFLGMLVLVSLARFVRLATTNPAGNAELWLALLGIAVVATIVLAGAAWDSGAALRGLWLGTALILLYLQWGTGWHLNQVAANDPRERWVVAGTHHEVRLLADTLRNISRQTVGGDYDLALFSVVESPVLTWYLRDFYRFQSGAAVPIAEASDIVITPVESDVALSDTYVGTEFRLLRQGAVTPPAESQSPVLDSLRWWLFHEPVTPANDLAVIVWVRDELAGR